MSSKKVDELARAICSNLGSDHHSDLVAVMIQGAMSELLDKTHKVCDDAVDYDFGEEMSVSTDSAKDLLSTLKEWTDNG